jgi:hypothetical protein
MHGVSKIKQTVVRVNSLYEVKNSAIKNKKTSSIPANPTIPKDTGIENKKIRFKKNKTKQLCRKIND